MLVVWKNDAKTLCLQSDSLDTRVMKASDLYPSIRLYPAEGSHFWHDRLMNRTEKRVSLRVCFGEIWFRFEVKVLAHLCCPTHNSYQPPGSYASAREAATTSRQGCQGYLVAPWAQAGM